MSDPSIMEKSWDELPDPKRVWIGKPGSHEEGLGRLVLLTPERVLAAAQTQIKTGIRVNLGWDLTKLEYAPFNRQPCQLSMVPLLDGVAFDDVYTLNPRVSSLNDKYWRGSSLTIHLRAKQSVGWLATLFHASRRRQLRACLLWRNHQGGDPEPFQ